jgi:hypothetical protein
VRRHGGGRDAEIARHVDGAEIVLDQCLVDEQASGATDRAGASAPACRPWSGEVNFSRTSPVSDANDILLEQRVDRLDFDAVLSYQPNDSTPDRC